MALNPIIEAFLAAREQASRDYATDQHSILAREQLAEEAKRQQELFKNQQELQRTKLAQEKYLAEADYKLRQEQQKEMALIHNREQLGRTREQMVKDIGSGLINPMSTILTGGQNVQVGQPGQMDAALTQIPTKPQGFDPNINLETGMFGQLGMPTAEDFNTAPWKDQLPGGEEQAREILKSITPYETQHQRKLDDLEIGKALELRAALEKEQGIFDIREPSKVADRRSKFWTAEANRISNEKIAKGHDAARLEAARMQAASRLAKGLKNDGVEILASDLTNVINGNFTQQRLQSLYGSKVRQAIVRHATAAGIKPLDDADALTLKSSTAINETIKNVQHLSKLYNEGYDKHASEITALTETINGVLGNVARGVAGEKGVLTQPDIERVQQMLPTWFGKVKSGIFNRFTGEKFDINDTKVKELINYNKAKYKSVLYGMPDFQLQEIITKHGLEGLVNPPKTTTPKPGEKVKFSAEDAARMTK